MNAVTIVLIEDDDGHARLVEKICAARASAIRSPAVPTANVRFNACSATLAPATCSSCSISIFRT